jgi:hypothetical protein
VAAEGESCPAKKIKRPAGTGIHLVQHYTENLFFQELFLEFAAHDAAWQIKRKILLSTPLKGVRGALQEHH